MTSTTHKSPADHIKETAAGKTDPKALSNAAHTEPAETVKADKSQGDLASRVAKLEGLLKTTSVSLEEAFDRIGKLEDRLEQQFGAAPDAPPAPPASE